MGRTYGPASKEDTKVDSQENTKSSKEYILTLSEAVEIINSGRNENDYLITVAKLKEFIVDGDLDFEKQGSEYMVRMDDAREIRQETMSKGRENYREQKINELYEKYRIGLSRKDFDYYVNKASDVEFAKWVNSTERKEADKPKTWGQLLAMIIVFIILIFIGYVIIVNLLGMGYLSFFSMGTHSTLNDSQTIIGTFWFR